MATLHPTNPYNVQASLGQWLQTQLAAYVAPPTIPTTALTVNHPESGINPPAISLNHIPVTQKRRWQGDNAGGEAGAQAFAMMEVNVWVSRQQTDWEEQRRVMQGMIEDIVIRNPVVLVSSYATAATPSATLYKINLGDMDVAQTNPDPNPDIERLRMLVNYEWVRRA